MAYYPPSTVIPVYSVFMGVAIALTALRLWVRLSFARIPLGVDDYTLLLGLAIAIACNGIQYYNALKGTGGEAITGDEMARTVEIAHKIDWAMIVIEKAAFGATKLSILFFYRRIFGVWDSFRRVNNALLWTVLAWAAVFTLADVLICGAHPELIWGYDQDIALRRCGNRGALLLAFSVTSVATDLPILGLPFFYISRLQMPASRKWATGFVFFIGAVSTSASVLRLIFLIVSYPVGRLNFAYRPPPDDQTPPVLKVFNPTFWALAELWLGLWAANLPPCAPLLRGVNFRPYRILGAAYRWRTSSAASEGTAKPPRHPTQEAEGSAVASGDRRDSRADLWGRGAVPLVPVARHHTAETDAVPRDPPSLAPMRWTGTGRLSGFNHLSSAEPTSQGG